MGDDKHSQFFTLNSPLIPPGYKQTEVGLIPEAWKVTAEYWQVPEDQSEGT
jgi:hypothetical protein